jgi:hypothetical protein
MATKIEIDGIDVQIYESSYDYASQNANFPNYIVKDIDSPAFKEKNKELEASKVLVRPTFLYKDLNFLIGKRVFNSIEFPEIVELGSIEYALVNFGEDEISYLRRDAIDEPVYILIHQIVRITDGVYWYIHPFDINIFETKEAAQVKADEFNNSRSNDNRAYFPQER